MLPIVLDVQNARLVLMGEGAAITRRLALCDAAGARRVRLFAPEPQAALAKEARTRLRRRWPTLAELRAARIVFIADMELKQAAVWARRARAAGALVNVEDVLPWCDFHMPAMVRRGDLLLTASTGGGSPALARLIREKWQKQFPPSWAARLRAVERWRAAARAEGATPSEIFTRTAARIEKKGWLT